MKREKMHAEKYIVQVHSIFTNIGTSQIKETHLSLAFMHSEILIARPDVDLEPQIRVI